MHFLFSRSENGFIIVNCINGIFENVFVLVQLKGGYGLQVKTIRNICYVEKKTFKVKIGTVCFQK